MALRSGFVFYGVALPRVPTKTLLSGNVNGGRACPDKSPQGENILA